MKTAEELLNKIAFFQFGDLPVHVPGVSSLDNRVRSLERDIHASWESLNADEKVQVEKAFRKMQTTLGEHLLSLAAEKKREIIMGFLIAISSALSVSLVTLLFL